MNEFSPSEYSQINTKEKLKSYAEKSKAMLNSIEDQKEIDFVLTFNNPVNNTEVRKFLSNVSNPLVYGRGINQDNQRVTIGLTQFDVESIELVENSKDYAFQGFIQIEGKATGAILKKFQKDSNVYAIEVAKDSAPMGLYWKLEDTK